MIRRETQILAKHLKENVTNLDKLTLFELQLILQRGLDKTRQ